MIAHDNIYYIKSDKWEEFLNTFEQYGFILDPKYIYPQAITRDCSNGKRKQWIRINITEPCVNIWDNEDKNKQREIWLYYNEKDICYGKGAKEITTEYITDLINAGFVKKG